MPRRFFDTDSLLVTHLPNVRYLTGFTGTAGVVLITPRQKLFFTDFRYTDQARQQVRGYQVRIMPGAALAGACQYAVRRRLKLGVLGFEADHVCYRDYRLLRRVLKGVKLRDQTGAIEKMRIIKRPDEVKHIREACALVDRAYQVLTRRRVVGRTEQEVAWMLEAAMRDAGSGAMPFGIIVASGPRSAMPHGAASGRVIRRNELVVIDMGASVAGYVSDATRTFATGKRLSARLKEIYGIVQEAQQRGCAAARAGATLADVDAAARNIITEAGYGKEFGHSLGHGVGLEAHEAPVLSHRSRGTLRAGMTVTVEPGIYLPRQGGVRIEDTVLITAGKPERLTGFSRQLVYLK